MIKNQSQLIILLLKSINRINNKYKNYFHIKNKII